MDREDGIPDVGLLNDEYASHWGVLGDKGYQGVAEFCRAVTPHKKPMNRGINV